MKTKTNMNSFLKHPFLMTLICLGVLGLSSVSSLAQEAPDPCPVPKTLAQESPPDMASVQADIDILSLCVERAKLLEQLNVLVQEMDGSIPAVIPSDLNSFDPLKAVDAELFELPKGTETNLPSKGAEPSKEIIIEEAPEAVPVQTEAWLVRKIGGNQTDGIQAELKNIDGGIVRVKKGDTLLDGHYVRDVSIMGVVLEKAGKVSTLGWETTE